MSSSADSLVWSEQPTLRRPVMVAGFTGWNDAADAASGAADWIASRFATSPFATIDPQRHYDFRSVRPQVEISDGVTRAITWPRNEFSAAETGGTHDLVVLLGVEPSLGWLDFCRSIIAVARQTACELIVTLGALLADVPHTRAMHITGTATDPELIARLHLERSRYEGPTGIVGVLHDACRGAGLVSASLWAPVPHYVATPPNPMATRELVAHFARLTGLPVDTRELDTAAAVWRAQVDDALEDDADVRTYVRQLEERVDADRVATESDLPSGEDLAAELERYLREHGEGNGSGDA